MVPRSLLFQEVAAYDISGPITLCGRKNDLRLKQIDTASNFVILYLIPQLILAFCHFRIGLKLWTSRRPGHQAGPTSGRPHVGVLGMRERKRVTIIVFAITIVFAIGWLPMHLYHLAEDFNDGQVPLGDVIDRGTIALLFSFGANALNPIVYCLFSRPFRKHFRQMFRMKRTSGLVTSLDTDVTGMTKRSDDLTIVRTRPPVVLLPRPASIFSSPPSSPVYKRLEDGIHSHQRVSAVFENKGGSLQPLLDAMEPSQTTTTTLGSCADLVSQKQHPVSTETITTIALSSCENMTSDECSHAQAFPSTSGIPSNANISKVFKDTNRSPEVQKSGVARHVLVKSGGMISDGKENSIDNNVICTPGEADNVSPNSENEDEQPATRSLYSLIYHCSPHNASESLHGQEQTIPPLTSPLGTKILPRNFEVKNQVKKELRNRNSWSHNGDLKLVDLEETSNGGDSGLDTSQTLKTPAVPHLDGRVESTGKTSQTGR